MVQVEDLSKEVQLLFMMTDIFMYEGFENLQNVIELQDEIKSSENNLCAIIAKAFCYEQIIEQMVNSLYIQDILWKRVVYKNVDYNETISKKYYIRLKEMKHLMNFQRLNEFKKCCNNFRKVRNLFAHNLVNYKIDMLVNNYKDLDALYEKIYEIYSEQNLTFVNGISQKLEHPVDFLICGKSYLADISIIREEALLIKAKKDKTYEDLRNLANLHQIFRLLKEWNDIGNSSIEIWLKGELLGMEFYEYVPVKEWDFEDGI